MKILSYNIRSWYRDLDFTSPRYWRKRAESIRHLIERESPDVIFLQEALQPMTRKVIPSGYVKATRGSISHHIFIRKGLAVVERHKWTLHTAHAVLRFPDAHRERFVSVHSHWNKRIQKRVFKRLGWLFFSKDGGIFPQMYPTIIGGDWNCLADETRAALFPPYQAIVTPGCATFRNWATEKQAQLDYFVTFYGKTRAGLAYKCSFSDSDHLPVILETQYI